MDAPAMLVVHRQGGRGRIPIRTLRALLPLLDEGAALDPDAPEDDHLPEGRRHDSFRTTGLHGMVSGDRALSGTTDSVYVSRIADGRKAFTIQGRRVDCPTPTTGAATLCAIAGRVVRAVLDPPSPDDLANALALQDGICAAVAHAAGTPTCDVTLSVPGPFRAMTVDVWSDRRGESAQWRPGPDHTSWTRVEHARLFDQKDAGGMRLEITEGPTHAGPGNSDAMAVLRAYGTLPPAPQPVIPESAWGPPF